MEKCRISYAVLHHLRQGRCLVSCKICCSIRNNFSICRRITHSKRPSDRSTICSVSGECIKEFPKTSVANDTFVRNPQPEESGEGNKNEMANSEASSKAEMISFETSGNAQKEGGWLKRSFRSGEKQGVLKVHKLRHNQCVTTLLHKTYVNLKDNHLLPNQQNQVPKYQTDKKCLSLAETMSLPNQNDHASCLGSSSQSELLKQSSKNVGSLPEKSRACTSCSPSIKDVFNCNMYTKYQCPTSQEAEKLSAMFPEPEKLVSAVVESMMRVDENCAPRLLVTDHLQRRYWKAQLTLTHPQNLTVRGKHPDRDKAIHGAYLHMCQHLKNLGLIFESRDGKWMPMTYDRVITMLEMLSKYGVSSIGSSRGRGFKIILEQAKDQKRSATAKFEDEADISVKEMQDEEKCFGDKAVENCFREKIGICQSGIRCVQENENIRNVEIAREDLGLHNVPLTSVCANSIRQCCTVSQSQSYNISNVEMENIDAVDRDLLTTASYVGHRSKPKWICTIHVGWPFPFSVRAEGLSLPAAQILGCMAVITKLKIKGLLTACNSSLSSRNVEHFILVHTQRHWMTCLQNLGDKASLEKFDADAEVFCDASVKGFGAFLTLKGTQQVSWLSEQWQEHQIIMPHILCHNQKIHTLMAELFTVVTAVFTWKHKLRSRRLLCFSDNVTVMGFINSYTSEPLKPIMCRNSMDYLVHTLQTTCRDYSIQLQASWLDRQENWLADCLSRNDVVTFRSAVPEAAVNKTKAKKLIIKEGTCI